jgi:uncharacterized protein with HEPN domain
MRLSSKDLVRLEHIRDAALEAIEHAEGRLRGDLDTDRQLKHSLVRCIEIIGEAANSLSAELRSSSPQIAWQQIIAARNRMIHAYFSINLDIVWRTVQERLPSLAAEVQSIIAAEEADR